MAVVLTDKIDSLILNIDGLCTSTSTECKTETANASKDAFVIITKWPIKGKCKTRLSKGLGTDLATEFAMCALKDLLLFFKELQREKFILFAPKEAAPNFQALLKELKLVKDEYRLIAMRDSNLLTSNLGSKFSACVQDLRAKPYAINGRISFIGSDCLELRPAHFVRTADQQHAAYADKVHIIPASDGGYVMIDLPPNASPQVFDDVLWSNEKTCQSQIAQIKKCGVEVVKDAQVLSDVDEIEDWLLLCRHFGIKWSAKQAANDEDSNSSGMDESTDDVENGKENEKEDTEVVQYNKHFSFVSALLRGVQ
mmetsp:Transcript_27899/g.44230  ORF Transcript_27899/g.44230 Transcript_27899/m.44230 type:complete len:311 (+) Transcript_27899:38-970(+)|eukprot:CAMPEP_0197055474 /NCGR_PEP_ID=MMETSP1384-20130603/66315_1 /TAXON_ID=29189 /ORGANISM="Ammonia sp." /LENGTH=310 /DNA_ID=CAMNT_0042489067 /DNA_START=25 /DNA_END=957 /DNA_ORIENTATION=-